LIIQWTASVIKLLVKNGETVGTNISIINGSY